MDLKVQQEKLQTERDEAYQLRDQALQQNARQLMALTKLTPQAQRAGEKLWALGAIWDKPYMSGPVDG